MYQRIIISGNLGKDPQTNSFDWGKLTTFSVAITERGFTTKEGKEIPPSTEWFNCITTRGLAEIAEKYLKKGDRVLLEGKLKTRSWEKDGNKYYKTELIVNELILPARQKTEDLEPKSDDLPFQ